MLRIIILLMVSIQINSIWAMENKEELFRNNRDSLIKEWFQVINDTQSAESFLEHIISSISDKEGDNNANLIPDLIKLGVDINKKSERGYFPLFRAALNGKINILAVLCDLGAKINEKSVYDETPLMVAAEKGHTEICKLLLKKGAEVNCQDNIGFTALHRAVRNEENLEICTLLLEYGALTTIRNKEINECSYGETPLERAQRKGNKKICKLLRQHMGNL